MFNHVFTNWYSWQPAKWLYHAVATEESGLRLVQDDHLTTPIPLETLPLPVLTMETKTTKPWATFWFSGIQRKCNATQCNAMQCNTGLFMMQKGFYQNCIVLSTLYTEKSIILRSEQMVRLVFTRWVIKKTSEQRIVILAFVSYKFNTSENSTSVLPFHNWSILIYWYYLKNISSKLILITMKKYLSRVGEFVN